MPASPAPRSRPLLSAVGPSSWNFCASRTTSCAPLPQRVLPTRTPQVRARRARLLRRPRLLCAKHGASCCSVASVAARTGPRGEKLRGACAPGWRDGCGAGAVALLTSGCNRWQATLPPTVAHAHPAPTSGALRAAWTLACQGALGTLALGGCAGLSAGAVERRSRSRTSRSAPQATRRLNAPLRARLFAPWPIVPGVLPSLSLCCDPLPAAAPFGRALVLPLGARHPRARQRCAAAPHDHGRPCRR